MDNSLKKIDRNHPKNAPAKVKTKTFLIGKETENKRLTANRGGTDRASGPRPKPESKPPDSLRQGASQAAGAAPTLRYGPAGDSAPPLQLKAAGMTERFPFGPSHTARPPPFPS